MPPSLSKRAALSASASADRFKATRIHANSNAYHPATNPDGLVALAIAENKLMHHEISSYISNQLTCTSEMLTYGEGSSGSKALKTAMAGFINKHFKPLKPVETGHLCFANGAASALDDLMFCLCEPGDGVLIGKPYYVGYTSALSKRADVKPVFVDMEAVDPMSTEALGQFEKALEKSKKEGVEVKVVLISNPHNPLGRPYKSEVLELYLGFCGKHDIHLISDEVFAMSTFPSRDFPDGEPFVSILSLDVEKHCNPSLVHAMYGMSKDFCASGIRLGCAISQSNTDLMKSLIAVAPFTRGSTLAEQAWMVMLRDDEFLTKYFVTLKTRLTKAYDSVTDVLKAKQIPYMPASAGVSVLLDLSRWLPEDTQEGELDLCWTLLNAKVGLGMASRYGAVRYGCFRFAFTSPWEEVNLGLKRLCQALDV